MKLKELLYGIEYTGDADSFDADVTYLCYDSRRASSGALFVALSGSRADGHNYVGKAYDVGCRVFLCEREVDLPSDACVIITENTRRALAHISQNFFSHPERELHIIGITGTKGKTTTSLMTAAVLCEAGYSCGYIGSNGVRFAGKYYATENTTPESYELSRYFRMMADAGVTHVVIEVSSQALFNYRVEGIEFDVCAFTNLYHDHVGRHEHPTFEHYKASKKRLFTEYRAKFITYCADDPSAEYMIEDSRTLTSGFSIAQRSSFMGTDISKFRDETLLGVKFTLKTDGWERTVKLPTPGHFSVYNALCAASIADFYGVSPDVIVSGLEKCTPDGRFQIVPAMENVTFIIDYAHNGVSLRHALSVIREYEPSRLICLFGSVGDRTEERRAELAHAAGELSDFAVITSDNPGGEDPDKIISEIEEELPDGFPHICITDREAAIEYAVDNAKAGDIVLLAGKGHEDYQLIRGDKVPFCERELILKYAGKSSDRYAFKPEGQKQMV